jgi:hypothetical protein
MKTLKAFWHWVDNEKPAPELYAEKAGDTLSEVAHQALIEAERFVGGRAGAASVELLDRVSDEEHRFLRPAFRDLSLALCAALEHMHGQVEDDYLGKRYPARPDFQTHANAGDHGTPVRDFDRFDRLACEATPLFKKLELVGPIVPQCPSCCSKPCAGTHAGCNLQDYLAAHPEAQAVFKREYSGDWVTGVDLASDASEETLQKLEAWLPAPRACDGPLTGKRVTQADLDRVNAQMRGSLGFAQDAVERVSSGWATMQQLANMPGPVLGRPVMNDDGLKSLRPEPSWTHTYHGRTGSNWDSVKRRLEVYTCIDRAGIDRLRGLAPRTITIRGRASDYAPDVIPYLRDVIFPMAMYSAVTNFPEADEALKLALGF